MLNMFEVLANVKCGTLVIDQIVPNTVGTAVDILKIAIPILLIVFGILDLAKAVMSNDEKEMKGAQSKFIKRCLYAVLVFFIVALVQFIFGQLAKAQGDNGTSVNESSITECISCFINKSCSPAK